MKPAQRRPRWPYIVNALGHASPPIVALLTAPALAQALGAENRGAAAAATAPVLLIAALASFGFPDVLTVLVGRAAENARLAARRALLMASALATMLLVAGAMLSRQLWPPEVAGYVLIALPSIPLLTVLALLRGLALGLGAWTWVGLERILGAAGRGVPIAALFLFGGLDLTTAVIALAYGPAAGILIYLPLLWRVVIATPRALGTSRELGYAPLASFGAKVWVGSLAGVILSRADQTLFVSAGGALTALGVYAVAVAIGEIPFVASQAIRELVLSKDSSKIDDNRLLLVSRLSFAGALLTACAIALTLPFLVPALFGDQFAEATLPAAILLLAASISIPGTIAGARLTGHGSAGLRSISLVAALIANIAFIYLLIPSLGAVGAALATLISNVLGMTLNLSFVRRRWSTPIGAFFIPTLADFGTIRELLRRK